MAKKWWSTKRATKVVLNPDGESVCTYHWTDVVTWEKGYVTLRTGGYDTLTTRDRMNQCADEYGLGYGVYREKGETYLVIRNKHVCNKGNVWAKENRVPLHTVEGKRIKVTNKRRPTNCGDCALKLLADAGETGYYA